MPTRSRFDTHEIFNQSPPYVDIDLFTSDTPLAEAVAANGNARALVGHLAVLASADALRAGAPTAVSDAFIKTRMADRHSAIYGAAGLDDSAIELLLQRALPEM